MDAALVVIALLAYPITLAIVGPVLDRLNEENLERLERFFQLTWTKKELP